MTWSIVQAEAVAWLDSLPADSADALVTSPPYEDARLYLENGEDLGIARDAEEWVSWMLDVVRAAVRVVRGVCVFVVEGKTKNYSYTASPMLLQADLVRAGYTLRKPPIYRRNGIPGSGGPDWFRNDYETCICVTRGGKLPWSDNTALGHPPKHGPGGEMSYRTLNGERVNKTRHKTRGTSGHSNGDTVYHAPGTLDRKITKIANPANVIDIDETDDEVFQRVYDELSKSSEIINCGAVGGGHLGNANAHANEAPFPEQLPAFFVLSCCPPGGVVLDPFAGSGSTLAVAVANGRNAMGCDLRASQVEIAERRLRGETPSLFGGE